METVAVVVDPEFVLRQLRQEEDPLGRLARRLPGLELAFIRSGPLAEHLERLNEPATLAYYLARTEEVRPAVVPPENYPDRLSGLLAGAAVAAKARFALTDNQELTHLPFPGGKVVDEWDLVDALAAGETGESFTAGAEPSEASYAPGKTESVFKCSDEVQCNMLESLLAEEGIACLVKSQEVTSLDGILATGAGFWAELHVFAADAARAKRLIGEFLAARTEE